MIASARRSRSWRSGSTTEVWCRTCSCFIGLLHPLILLKEPENGETELSSRIPLQLLPLRLDDQVNRFMGCDCHIEVWHKVLKSGCRIEARQLESAARLQRCLTLFSVIAWRIVYATMLSRLLPELPCTVLLALEEWQALYCATHHTPTPPPTPPTLHEAVQWIARLGGFLTRPGDGEPGGRSCGAGFSIWPISPACILSSVHLR
jgi:hypothetical protein